MRAFLRDIARKIDRLGALRSGAHAVRAMRIGLTKDANIYTSLGPGVQLSRLAAFYLARQLRQRYAKRLY